MKTLKIKHEHIEQAKTLYSFGALNNSITKGEGNIIGALGEVVLFDYFTNSGFSTKFDSNFNYDITVDRFKVDVKTKRTTVEPKEHFYCSIPASNTKQACDLYFFARVTEDFKYCYLLGFKDKQKFFEESIFKKKGEKGMNGFKFLTDCYNLEISKLSKFRDYQ
jgi:hypothetical protein